MLEERVEFGEAKQMITADEDFSLPDTAKLKRVELACGKQKKDGWIGIDRAMMENVDIVHDLMQFPWPLEDESVYEFNCEHFVEHIPIQLTDGSYGLIKFMEEAWRCLMVGGTIHIVAPYYTSVRAWQDPTHARAITEVTFHYFNKKQAEHMLVDHYTGKCNFEIISQRFILNPEFEGLSDEARRWATRHYFNVVQDIQIMLRKVPLEEEIMR